jgi:hypothetical protein
METLVQMTTDNEKLKAQIAHAVQVSLHYQTSSHEPLDLLL